MTSPRSRPGRRCRVLTGLVLILGLALAPALPAVAERTQSDLVLIREDDTVAEDLYAAGNDIRIAGRVEGDLLAAAFDEITIDGEVTGSVMAVASRVVVSGQIGGSLRVAAREVVVTGEVGEDVLVAGWSTDVEPEAQIGRDLLVWARRAQLGGRVGRNVEGQQGRTRFTAQVDGDVEITTSSLEVGETARVEGDLVYISEADATVRSGADIGGTLLHRRPLPPNVRIRAFWLLMETLGLIGVTLLGVATIWAAPGRVAAAAGAVRRRPLAAVAWGSATVAAPLMLALVVGVVVGLSPPQAGIPLLLVLGPLVLAVASLVLVVALFAPVPVAMRLGSAVLGERSPYAHLLGGMLGVALLAAIPWVGSMVALAIVVIGVGSWIVPEDDRTVAAGSAAEPGVLEVER